MGWETTDATLDRLSDTERRFNSILAGTRTMASTWTLAALGGIAVLLRQDSDVIWVVSPFVLAGFVCAAASVGIAVLWMVDQLVYRKLLNSAFLIGMKIEFDNPNVPPVRTLMAHSSKGKGMGHWLKMFYIAPVTVLTFIALAIAMLSQNAAYSASSARIPYYAEWVFAGVSALSAVWILLRSREVPFFKRAEAFGDPTFAAMLRDGDYSIVLERALQRERSGPRRGRGYPRRRRGPGPGSGPSEGERRESSGDR